LIETLKPLFPSSAYRPGGVLGRAVRNRRHRPARGLRWLLGGSSAPRRRANLV